ncbi:MAG TPA: ribosome-associated translation inhibitor RaiA [Gammaproteobacteria bacterium]|nr:ribosome-associated translation inhibitor RaiA [Gammaproteobacteria bacterium]
MQLDVSGKNIEVTDALRTYVAEKVERVQRHLDDLRDAHVVLAVEKHRHFAEINLNANGTTLHADAEDKDMYAAIDAMADKIDRQARRHHGKATEHGQREARDAKEQPPGSGD